MITTNSSAYLTNLHRLPDPYFNVEEIRTLCFDLGVDYDSVRGEGRFARICELILALARSGRLPELLASVQEQRRHVVCPPLPLGFQLPASLESGSAAPVVQHSYYCDVIHGDQGGGDKTTVGSISNSQGVAIGHDASASVQMQMAGGQSEVARLFAALLAEVAHDATAARQVQALRVEIERGDAANDDQLADLISDIATAVPSAAAHQRQLFTHPAIAPAASGVTNYVLRRLG
jgi:hypothetical protein